MLDRRVTARALAVAVAIAAAVGAWLGGAAAGPSAVAGRVATGVVDVDTNLAYEGAAGAGTGIVLSASGEVLTNNHVIRGATTIRVTDVVSGRSYKASVLGYDVAADVALLKLKIPRGLTTAPLGKSAAVKIGDQVTAVGNANGTGGAPSVASGAVTALHQSVTVGDGRGGVERLSGLIRTNAALRPGDSGGPLLNGAGRVIGMDTAASVGFEFERGGSEGLAIPIDQATTVARQIDAGRSSASVHVGPTAFLGIRVGQADDGTSGALVEGVVSGSPADKAGIAPGDVVDSLNGHVISSPIALTSLLLRVSPGSKTSLRWLDQFGNTHSAIVRPVAGPPQ